MMMQTDPTLDLSDIVDSMKDSRFQTIETASRYRCCIAGETTPYIMQMSETDYNMTK